MYVSSGFESLFLKIIRLQAYLADQPSLYYFRPMDLITVQSLSKRINNTLAVDNISFRQAPLQKIAIAGETGSGKSSLLKMIAGWVQPDAGQILFRSQRILGPLEQLIPGRKEIAYLSQHFELRNNYRVYEILEYANEMHPDKAAHLYKLCQIDHLLTRRTDQLSGGEKQRIALARLLSTSPELLLMDEPFSNLDQMHKDTIKTVLDDLVNELNISCIMVSHDARDLVSWADQLMIMKDGKIIQHDKPETIYRYPANTYCAGLMGAFNLAPSKIINELLASTGKTFMESTLMIRPEHIDIVTADYGAAAIVLSVSFWGNYYIVTADIQGWALRIQVNEPNYKAGDQIYIRINPQYVWPLPDAVSL